MTKKQYENALLNDSLTVRQLKRGEYFKKSPTAKAVLVRGEYSRELKKYSCVYFDDINKETFIDGNKAVYTSFTF